VVAYNRQTQRIRVVYGLGFECLQIFYAIAQARAAFLLLIVLQDLGKFLVMNKYSFATVPKPEFDVQTGFLESFFKGDTGDWDIKVCPLDPLDSAPLKWVTSRLGELNRDEVPLHLSRERYGVVLPSYWSAERDRKSMVLDYSTMKFVCARWNQPEFTERRERNRLISCIDRGSTFHPPLKRSIHSEYSATFAFCMGLRHRYSTSVFFLLANEFLPLQSPSLDIYLLAYSLAGGQNQRTPLGPKLESFAPFNNGLSHLQQNAFPWGSSSASTPAGQVK